MRISQRLLGLSVVFFQSNYTLKMHSSQLLAKDAVDISVMSPLADDPVSQ